MAYVWPLSNTREFDDNGQLRDAKAYFYLAGTTTPLVVYTDSDLSIPHTSPVETNGTKRWPAVFLPFDTKYKVRVTTDTGVIVFEQDGLSTPPDVSGDDGGSSDVPTAERWQTGDLKARYGTGTHAGFVRANGRTIGSAASGATERANDDCEALFKHLWEVDSELEVSSGRSGSADADWAANKTIALPDWRGRAIAALDDMGNSAAGRLTASYFGATATVLGAAGGSESHTLTTAQMPSHNHTFSGNPLPSHTHGVTVNSGGNLVDNRPGSSFGGGGVGNATSISIQSASAGTPTGSISNTGSGQAHNNVQPTMLATIYIKL